MGMQSVHEDLCPSRTRHGVQTLASTTPPELRFVRFVYGPAYVTANVGPVTLCDSPGVRV